MAQEGSQKIGAINMQAAMTGTQEGKKAADALAAKLEPRKKVLDGKAAEIRGLQDKLQRGGAAMAETAKADLTRQIDERTKSYNRDMEDAQAELNDEQRVLISQMSNKMTTIIDKYAQEHGFHIIFDVSNPNTPLLYISNLIDVTRDVIELYDKANPATADSKPAPAPKPAVPATKK
jgi:Skp family chaperone for outer membrane proteins